jgi:hypothetical protein
MYPVIDKPAGCKIHSVFRLLPAKNVSAVEIHHELCTVYSQNIMHEGTVRQWHRMFKDGQTNVQSEERSARLAISSE